MEDFEELVPQNEFSDYIQLQREIKRLSQDNEHFMSENRHLLAKIKQLEADLRSGQSQDQRQEKDEPKVSDRDGKSWFNHDLINPFAID
jgi:hypothetical protein